MKALSIGIIGMGFHARTVHIPGYDLVPELRLRAIATSRESTAREAADRYRVTGYADYRELLRRDDIEAVVLCAPSHLHAQMCEAALNAGKHVLMETPGILDPPAARQMQDFARERGLVTQVAFLFRYSPAIDVLKDRMERAADNSPRILSYEFYPFLHHIYDLALYLSGPVERVVSAHRDTAGSVTTLSFHNGDTATVVGRALVNCGMSIESIRVSTDTFYASVEGRTRVRIIENMQPTGIEAWGIPSSAGVTYEPHVFGARYLEQSGTLAMLRAFVQAVREGLTPRSTLEDGAATAVLIEEIERKMRQETPQP